MMALFHGAVDDELPVKAVKASVNGILHDPAAVRPKRLGAGPSIPNETWMVAIWINVAGCKRAAPAGIGGGCLNSRQIRENVLFASPEKGLRIERGWGLLETEQGIVLRQRTPGRRAPGEPGLAQKAGGRGGDAWRLRMVWVEGPLRRQRLFRNATPDAGIMQLGVGGAGKRGQLRHGDWLHRRTGRPDSPSAAAFAGTAGRLGGWRRPGRIASRKSGGPRSIGGGEFTQRGAALPAGQTTGGTLSLGITQNATSVPGASALSPRAYGPRRLHQENV